VLLEHCIDAVQRVFLLVAGKLVQCLPPLHDSLSCLLVLAAPWAISHLLIFYLMFVCCRRDPLTSRDLRPDQVSRKHCVAPWLMLSSACHVVCCRRDPLTSRDLRPDQPATTAHCLLLDCCFRAPPCM
jgi:hypothetical protein